VRRQLGSVPPSATRRRPTPHLRPLRPAEALCTLLEETARRRLDALPLAAVVAQIAALAAGELLALARHLRPRLLPGEEAPAPEVAERIVQMSAEELRELERRLRERLVPASAEG
jgi:hypothetical protein